MNLYEFEGKKIFSQYGIATPEGILLRRGDDPEAVYQALGIKEVVVKAQVLSGKRGKNNGISLCSSAEHVITAATNMFNMQIRGQYVASLLIEERVDFLAEHYISISYDTNKKHPVLVYSEKGGVDIEEVDANHLVTLDLDVREPEFTDVQRASLGLMYPELADIGQKMWTLFLEQDARIVEINPLMRTEKGNWIAADAKIALDDDAFFKHEDWKYFEPRTMMGRQPTEREIAVSHIDEGDNYYRGTAGKYIEMDGSVAVLFSGGGASISNMDALEQHGLKAANYTEYSGNPPREKVHALAKIVLSKPGLTGLWIAGGVANFTNVEATFQGIVDALDEVKPSYPIVVRRAGPREKEGMKLMRQCAERNNLNMKLFGKDVSMDETVGVLAEMITKQL